MTDLRDQLQTTLGASFTLERELRGGGMSRVFVAEDTALARKIVVKVLPAEASASVSVERFKREIQTAARMQHPHIVPLLSAGETAGLPFYTMPYVKGDSLRARLTRGGELSVNEAMHILHDIAAALAYAHGEGVVHRDIKPDNVIVSGGVAVVTDFGVAKAMDLAATYREGAMSGLTSLGIALGTPAYMSPEQASADPHVDHRADIYSFGCVAYEVLAGTSPFAGRSVQQMLAAHVTDVPEPIDKRRPNTPPALASLIMKCLEKRAGDRPQSADELLIALDAIATPSGGATPTSARVPAARRFRIAAYAAGACVVASGAAVAIMIRAKSFRPYVAGKTTMIVATPSIEIEPSISADGKFVAFSGGTPQGFRIYVRQVDGGRPMPLTAALCGDHLWPRWSPDGTKIVFEANGAAYVVPAFGGTPTRVIGTADDDVITPSWSPDGKQLAYGDGKGLWVRSVDGGTPRLVVTRRNDVHSPVWSPDGQRLAYVRGLRPDLSNISTNSVWVTRISDTPDPGVRITDSISTNFSPVWSPDGNSVLFVSDVGGTFDVYQQPVRADGRRSGPAERVTTGLNTFAIGISNDGKRLAYDVVRRESNVWMATIGPDGTAQASAAKQITTENQTIESVDLSHDGKLIAYESNLNRNYDIYALRLDGGEPQRITSNPAKEFNPSWSPDGREIAFHSMRNGTRHIFTVTAEGQQERPVTSGSRGGNRHPHWSHDGKQLFYVAGDSTGTQVIATVLRQGERWSAPRALTRALATGTMAMPSPDGKLIGYTDAVGLWVVDANGGTGRLVADSRALGGNARGVAWSNDPSVVYTSVLPLSTCATVMAGVNFMAVPLAGGSPRIVMASDPSRPVYRSDFASDGRRIFFTVRALESDVFVTDLKR